MALLLTKDRIKAIMGGKRNDCYVKCVAKSDEILLITDGKGAIAKIKSYRPSEPEAFRKYREDNFRLITKAPFSKVLNSLAKIGRADDFKITYPKQAGVAEKDGLENYCEKNFPAFDSLTNWFFSIGLRSMLTEPNGWICVLPTEWGWDSQTYPKPYPTIYRANQVVDWEEGEFIFVLLDETVTIKDVEGREVGKGKVYLLVDRQQVVRYWDSGRKQEDGSTIYSSNILAEHGFDDLPAFKLGGFVCSASEVDVYESFIAGVVPYWTEALIENSDKQGAVKQHAYPESEEYAIGKCETCKGQGQYHSHGMPYGADRPINCEKCNGTGEVASPLGQRIRRAPARGEEPIPLPSKVYIEKKIEPLEFLDKDIEANIKKGYAALNMDFLAESPLAQSGVAKAYDREELHSFLHQIARHIVENILHYSYWYIIRWRYGLESVDAMDALMPTLTVPEHFDIVGLNALEKEITDAKTAGVDARIITAMNSKFAGKRFRNDPLVVSVIQLAMILDPLGGKSEDEKMTIKANGGVSADEYVMSANIEALIRLAIEEDEKFSELPFSKQRETLLKKAGEISSSIQKAALPIIPTPPPVV